MKQWKRLVVLSSAIVMAAATLTYFPNDTLQNIRLEISASAETTTEPQVWIEDNLTWTLTADGTLNISGTGAMKNYDYDNNPSSVCSNSSVKKVVIEDGVTSIGDAAFYGRMILFFAGEDGHAKGGDGHEGRGHGDHIIGAGGGVLLILGGLGLLGGGDNDGDGAGGCGTIDDSFSGNYCGFGFCLAGVVNIENIAGGSDIILWKIRFIPKQIGGLDLIVVDGYIGIQTGIEMECIYDPGIDGISGHIKGLATGELDSRAICAPVSGLAGQVGDGVAGDGNSGTSTRLHIDTPHKAGNSIVLKLNSFHAIRRHRLCEESKVLASIALEFAVINRYIDSLHDFQTALEGAVFKGYESFDELWQDKSGDGEPDLRR